MISNKILIVFLAESSSSIIQKITFSKITKKIPQQASQGTKGNKVMVVKEK
jgi:beta-mannanase